jgi:hypothetical protein
MAPATGESGRRGLMRDLAVLDVELLDAMPVRSRSTTPTTLIASPLRARIALPRDAPWILSSFHQDLGRR